MSNELVTPTSSNTTAVRNAVESFQLTYVARPALINEDRVTTIHYEGSDDRPGWTTNLFSSEDRPTVRMYSWIDLDTDEFDYLRVLETVNAANYTYLLDTVIDLTVDTHRLRVRDVHRPSGATVDENEFADSLGHHLAQVTLWSFVLQRVLRGAAPVTEMFDEAIDAATSIFESEDTPAEKGHDEQSS